MKYVLCFSPLQACILLIEHGAEVQSVGLQGRTPIHEACARGYFQLASLLLQHGANIHLRDEFNRVPLTLAVKGNRFYPELQEDLELYVCNENQKPGELMRLCRKVIRAHLGNSRVKEKLRTLPIPNTIIEYLMYCDIPIWSLFRPRYL